MWVVLLTLTGLCLLLSMFDEPPGAIKRRERRGVGSRIRESVQHRGIGD
jgi:hypothetical protein